MKMLYAARTVCATRSATRFWQRIGSRRFSSFDFLLHLAQASVDVTRFHLPRLVGLAARCSNQPRATCLVWETAHDPGAAFDRLAQSLPPWPAVLIAADVKQWMVPQASEGFDAVVSRLHTAYALPAA